MHLLSINPSSHLDSHHPWDPLGLTLWSCLCHAVSPPWCLFFLHDSTYIPHTLVSPFLLLSQFTVLIWQKPRLLTTPTIQLPNICNRAVECGCAHTYTNTHTPCLVSTYTRGHKLHADASCCSLTLQDCLFTSSLLQHPCPNFTATSSHCTLLLRVMEATSHHFYPPTSLHPHLPPSYRPAHRRTVHGPLWSQLFPCALDPKTAPLLKDTALAILPSIMHFCLSTASFQSA